MSIVRVNKQTGRFLVASAEVFEDQGLSFGARGLMAYLLTKPNNWEVRRDHLVSSSPAGRVKIQRMINELKDAGYMRRFQENDPKTGLFVTVTDVYEMKALNPDYRKTDVKPSSNGTAPPLETPTYGGTTETEATKPDHGDIVVRSHWHHIDKLEADPASLPPFAYIPPDPHVINFMISALSSVCKGYANFILGEQCPFYQSAVSLIENGVTEEQVRAFTSWWEKNHYYEGKPALKTLMDEIDNSIGGVNKNKMQGSGTPELDKAIDELERWVTGRQKASEFSSPHTLTAIQRVGESALRSINQYNRKQLIQNFTDEYERAKQGEKVT